MKPVRVQAILKSFLAASSLQVVSPHLIRPLGGVRMIPTVLHLSLDDDLDVVVFGSSSSGH